MHALYNPEAGSHPLPDDRRVIDAVLAATRRCYEAHPYFRERYGARGEAFANSDGGYLAVLTGDPQSHVDEQVVWLAGVLAARGMPRWLMEAHLDLLCDELCLAVPEESARFHKLLNAARLLRSARQSRISQHDFEALAAAFESSSGAGIGNAGGLLVAAACDEGCGLDQAVSSLIGWLGDPGRFSAQWCSAVAATLAHDRSLAAQGPGS